MLNTSAGPSGAHRLGTDAAVSPLETPEQRWKRELEDRVKMLEAALLASTRANLELTMKMSRPSARRSSTPDYDISDPGEESDEDEPPRQRLRRTLNNRQNVRRPLGPARLLGSVMTAASSSSRGTTRLTGLIDLPFGFADAWEKLMDTEVTFRYVFSIVYCAFVNIFLDRSVAIMCIPA